MTMKPARTTIFSWNLVANTPTSDRLRNRIEHEVRRICGFSTSHDKGKHHLLIGLRLTAEGGYEVELLLRHGRFLSHARQLGDQAETAFESAAAKLEEVFKRRRRFPLRSVAPMAPARPVVEPVLRTDPHAPKTPREVLGEMLGDYVRRLRRFVRRRLRTEAVANPETPVAAISDGDVVDEAVGRMLRVHPSEIPFGAFWPWAIQTCNEVLAEYAEEAARSAASSVSLDEDLPAGDDGDPGFDIEQPFYIIERMLYPPEEELEDATADARAAAPSTAAEYEEFIRLFHQVLARWPDFRKRVVESYCFEGLHPSEISAIEGVDEAEIIETLNQSLAALRRVMTDGEEPLKTT